MTTQNDGWIDVTSYSRDRKPEDAPCTWQLDAASPERRAGRHPQISLTVTKHIHHGDEWTLVAPELGVNENRGLGTNDLEEAKAKALRIAQARCNAQIVKLNAMLNKIQAIQGNT